MTEFVEALKNAIIELVPGGDFERTQLYGKIISKSHVNRLEKIVNEQMKVKGTTLICGGKSNDSQMFEPTILTLTNADPETNPIMKSEIFGPVLAVIGVSSIQEAIHYVNNYQGCPLAYYPFSKDKAVIESVLEP